MAKPKGDCIHKVKVFNKGMQNEEIKWCKICGAIKTRYGTYIRPII